MRILILGGTEFVGRHIAEAAAAGGHVVTLFNRGSHPEVLPELERVIGDRDANGDAGLQRLAGRSFDAVIDVSGYLPRVVRDSARLLRDAVHFYLFISTISVYERSDLPGRTESAPLAELADPTTETIDATTYGALKVACEREVLGQYGPDRAVIVRPGVVVGPYDPTDRFTYWVRRVARGGELLAPGAPDAVMQWIDGRDLAAFAVSLLERGVSGTFNAVIPPATVTMGKLLAEVERAATAAAGAPAEPRDGQGGRSREPSRPTWVDESFIEEQQVRPFADLPMWLPRANDSLLRVSPAAAQAAGLSYRSLQQTVRGVLAWDSSRGHEPLKAGLTEERERSLLAAWHGR